MKRIFGRHAAPDPRDRRFLFRPRATRRRRRWWDDSRWFGDQGTTSQCVGFAWAHWLSCSPVRNWLDPAGIYTLAQHLDEWQGNDYEGTSVRAGAKVLKRLGLVVEYRWATAVEAISAAVLECGPVVLGTQWYEGMSSPNASGVMHVEGRMEAPMIPMPREPDGLRRSASHGRKEDARQQHEQNGAGERANRRLWRPGRARLLARLPGIVHQTILRRSTLHPADVMSASDRLSAFGCLVHPCWG